MDFRKSDRSIDKQILENYRLTTAEILYHMPDHPSFLQSYIWQEYDIAPKFPELFSFLNFWEKKLDGSLHSVYVADKKIISASEFNTADADITIQ